MEKKKKFYAIGEKVKVKDGVPNLGGKTVEVVSLDLPNHGVTVTYTESFVSASGYQASGISTFTAHLKLWDITKAQNNQVSLPIPQRKNQPHPSPQPLEIKVKYLTALDDEFKPLEKIAIGDWIDMRAAESVQLQKGESRLISLGVAMQLPAGYEALLAPRSSTFKKYKVLQSNGFGVVDSLYCSDDDIWRMPVLATEDTFIGRGDRIAQFRIQRCMPEVKFVTVETLGNKTRGGFGSTGVK